MVTELLGATSLFVPLAPPLSRGVKTPASTLTPASFLVWSKMSTATTDLAWKVNTVDRRDAVPLEKRIVLL
jgi:hypothetical protein